MVKVLIVDDEIMIRIGLKSAIPWEANGFQVVGEASNGEEAYGIFLEKSPDIILTDIKMPLMDGLQLIEKVKEVDDTVKIIILSCYNEFEFVKRAMRLGADDYLLKAEFNENELLEKTIKLKEELLQNRIEKQIIRDVKSVNTHSNRNKLLKELIWGVKFERGEALEKLKLFDIRIHPDSFALVIIKTDDEDILCSKWADDRDGLFSSAFINIVEEIINDFQSGIVFENQKEYVLILNVPGKSELKAYENISSICDKIKDSVLRYLNVRITMGISSIQHDLCDLKKGYREAESTLQKQFFLGRGRTIFYGRDDLSGSKRNERDAVKLFDEKQLFKAVEAMDGKGLEETLQLFFAGLAGSSNPSIESIENRTMELLYSFKKHISYLGYDIDEVLEAEFNPVHIVKSRNTFDELAEEVKRVMLKAVDLIAKRRSDPISKPVQRAIEYINMHYAENISLMSVASHLGLNMSYVSNLFKAQVGESFTEYLTKVRIKKAKQLILQRKYKIYEIAEMVGCPNEAYFSTLFKKVTGVNPKDYCGKN